MILAHGPQTDVFFNVFVEAPTGPDPCRVPGEPRGGPKGGRDPRRAL